VIDIQNQSRRPHDAFISYSRHDRDFARALEGALERYRPPRGVNTPRRRLDVFRDEQDFVGVEYYRALDQHLKQPVQRSSNRRIRGLAVSLYAAGSMPFNPHVEFWPLPILC
jgi:hypothetical protein